MHKTAIGTLKYALVLILTVGGLVLQPAVAAGASSASDPVTPPTGERQAAWLERIWLRQQRVLDVLGFMFDHSQQRLGNAQEFIDRAAAAGKDVDALQAAVDAFSEAVQAAKPLVDDANAMLRSHKGFDGNGNVVDAELASTTVDAMAEKLETIRDALLQPGRDLRDAIRDFRWANRPVGD